MLPPQANALALPPANPGDGFTRKDEIRPPPGGAANDLECLMLPQLKSMFTKHDQEYRP